LYCVTDEGVCRSVPPCNSLVPTCKKCGKNQYCASDCTCHFTNELMPDLSVGLERLQSDLLIETDVFDDASCACSESCTPLGTQRLLRFSTETINSGYVLLNVPDRTIRPDLFQWGECHGHWHFMSFALHELYDITGALVTTGGKRGYCLEDEDIVPGASGPWVNCQPLSTCNSQALQAGWNDLYEYNLDCQWVVITNLLPGWYKLQVTVNFQRKILENTYDNNRQSLWVQITNDTQSYHPRSLTVEQYNSCKPNC